MTLEWIDPDDLPTLLTYTQVWKGKGQTPGTRLMNIRAVSIMARHLSPWHCVERGLRYGAAALGGGFEGSPSLSFIRAGAAPRTGLPKPS